MVLVKVLSDLGLALRTAAADLIDPSRVHERERLQRLVDQLPKPNTERGLDLLHVLWGKAKDGPNYVKAEWVEFSGILYQLGLSSHEQAGPITVSAPTSSTGAVRKVPASELHPSPVGPPLPEDLLNRVAALHERLSGVYDQSLESWIEGFQRDANPAGEIRWWERLASAFECTLGHVRVGPDKREDLFRLVFNVAIGATEDEIRRTAVLLPDGAVEYVHSCIGRR